MSNPMWNRRKSDSNEAVFFISTLGIFLVCGSDEPEYSNGL